MRRTNDSRWTVRSHVVVLLVVTAVGCAHNPFKTAPQAPPSLEPPPGVAVPAHTLQPSGSLPPSYTDVDPRQAQATMARSRQESELMQDEITALREQLASTSAQLAQARGAGSTAATAGGAPGAVTSETPANLRESMSQLSLGGIDTRFDGAVVRIDLPADRLFETGTANIGPGGVALLTEVADELERVYPGHFIGIEGHIDSEPLRNASWASPHQLTAARASAVFDFLTTRTRMHAEQLFLVAHGANHPVVSNATAAGRAKNRRVELVVYPERSKISR